MPNNNTDTKKFLDTDGVGHLWKKIKNRYDSKLSNVVAQDDSIVITNGDHIGVQVSSEEGNILQLKTTGNKGLFVPERSPANTYTISKLANPSKGAIASYALQAFIGGTGDPVDVGVTIDIPKNIVVGSGDSIDIHELGTAAYTSDTDYDKAGAAENVYASIQALSNSEIDSAIAAASNL